MGIFFTDETALEFWRWHATSGSMYVRPKLSRIGFIPEGMPSSREVLLACERFHRSDEKVSIMVSSSNYQLKHAEINCVVCSTPLPSKSFYRIAKDVYVASPELMFVRLANGSDILQMIKLGCEITGKYKIDDDDMRGFSKCEAIASGKSIERYVSSASRLRGIRVAKHAARYIVPNAYSPMETDVSLVLSLPKALGGYGLPKPVLNYELNLNQEDSIEYGRNRITMDMVWPERRFAIEYDSNQWHMGEMKFVEDSKRRNDIRSLGYDVTTLTFSEFKDMQKMDRFVKVIRKRLNVKETLDPKGYTEKKFLLKRNLDLLRKANFPDADNF